MANPGLTEAFSDCVDRLLAGQSVDECLAAYPQYAAELRALLETGTAVRRAAPPVPPEAIARVYARVMQAASHVETPRRPFLPVSRLAAAAVLAVVILVIALIAGLFEDDDERLRTEPIPSATATITATPTASCAPTRTPQASRTPLPTYTATPSPSPTRTPTITASPSPTPTACVVSAPGGWVVYTIQPGDNLSTIAAARGIAAEELQRANCLFDPALIVAGRTILAPSLPAPATTSPPPPAQPAPSAPGPMPGPGADVSGDDSDEDDDEDDDDGDEGGDDDEHDDSGEDDDD